MSKLRYDLPETVWNSYEVRNIELEVLEPLLKKHNGNIWTVQALNPELRISVELSEPCFDFIESEYDKYEIGD